MASFIFALNAFLLVAAAGAIYIAGRKRLQGGVWLIYNILLSIWSFCIYRAFDQAPGSSVLFWIRASLIPLVFIPPVFLHFLSIYSDKEVFRNKTIKQVYIFFLLLFAALFSMPELFIKGALPGGFKYVVSPGPAFGMLTFIFAGFLSCGFYYLLRSAKKVYLIFRRNQRIWIFLGMFLSVIAPLSFFLSAYKIKFFSFGVFCVIPYLALTGYAVLKYHVPEVTVLFKRLSLLSYSTLIIIVMYIFAVQLFHGVIGIGYFESSVISGCIILLNVLFTAHYGGVLRLNKLADNAVYKKRSAYYKFLEDFNRLIKEKRDLYTLLSYLVDSMMSIIGVKCVMLYLFEEENSAFKLTVYRGIDRRSAKELGSISATSHFIDFLKDGNIFVAAETSDFTNEYNLLALKKAFERFNVKLTVPLFYTLPLYKGSDIAAFMCMGEKTGGEPYNEEDVDILNAFGRELSICIDKAKLFAQVISDDLTKLYRHNYFYKRLEEELERSRRYGRVFSLLFVDVDNFKSINDVFGHMTGDIVLARVAHVIGANLRKVDIAARYGGEEFAVLLPETGAESVPIVAERIRKLVEEDFNSIDTRKQVLKQHFAEGVRFRVTVSIGMSTYKKGASVDAIVREADKALYKAKWEGKNKSCSV